MVKYIYKIILRWRRYLLAQNGYSKMNFLSYQGLMNQIENDNQAPTANVTSHNSDPMTYREMYYVVKTINNEMNKYERQLQAYQNLLNDNVALTLGAFTQLLIKKGVANQEEMTSLIKELKKEQDNKYNDKH